jgi:hypothetical protein
MKPAAPTNAGQGFRPASRKRVAEILATLIALGQARSEGEKYSV